MLHKEKGLYQQKPLDTIGMVIIEHPAITLTQQLMARLAQARIAVLFCDASHHPATLLLHMEGHSTQTAHFREQLKASNALKKQLWKQTVEAKIHNQQKLLHFYKIALSLPQKTTSGDTKNVEAQAARLYWPALFGHSFFRSRHGPPPNPALNYGYAILRAATARALSLAGLLPLVGIHHKNKYNNFCLADDIMEPYRPFVDLIVKKMTKNNLRCNLKNKEEKKTLLALLQEQVLIKKEKTILMVAIQRTAQSLAQCFTGEKKQLLYPYLPSHKS